MVILLLILCGLIAGCLSGMLGIGGGVIIVPALYFLFRSTDLFQSNAMQIAASTSLAISLCISLFSSLLQHSKRNILFSAFKFLAPGLVLGCVCGVFLSRIISSELIRLIFGILALLLGIYFAIPRLPHLSIAASPNPTLSLFGLIIGMLSSLLGIGGGVLTFPTFLGYGMEPKASSGTSSATTALSTFIGTLSYLIIDFKYPELPGTIGHIYLFAFLIIGIAALITTPLGIKLSHTLNVHLIKRIFGGCLSFVGLTMILL